MAGYSGKSLGKKLGLKANTLVFLSGMPHSIRKELSQELADVRLIKKLGSEGIDFIHAFVSSADELNKNISGWKKSMAKTGMLWISWPKKTSSISTDLSGDIVRETGLASGLVDVKVCAVDEDWSGHKFVFRTKDR